MKNQKGIALLLSAVCVASLLTGCQTSEKNTSDSNKETVSVDSADNKDVNQHEAITIESPLRNLSELKKLVKEQYPEINLEVIPYSGWNMSAYLKGQLRSGDMPDIYVTTAYSPGVEDVSDKLIDLSGYSFTGNYSEARLAEVSDNGAIYLLPSYYTCMGITYNKTLLEKNGWELPTSFKELEELAPKVKEAGYNLAINQIQFPGYGFQYLCNILDTTFLNTLQGRQWQNNFLNCETTVADTPEMKEALEYVDKWREIGMLNGDGDSSSDDNTRLTMGEGNTLFMLGNSNDFKEGETTDEFGLMPYLSENGDQNTYILMVSRYMGLNKYLEDEGNETKLEDAIHVMEVMSSVEGFEALNDNYATTALYPLKDYTLPDNNIYKSIEEELNAGETAPFIYSGWEDMIVPIGTEMISYMKGDKEIDDMETVIDKSQELLKDNSDTVYTTVSEKIDNEGCAELIGIAFGKASHADMALISKNKWYEDDADLNKEGVSGALFALPVTDQELTSILPTGWNDNIQTVTLSGKRINELLESGYDRNGDGRTYPYQFVAPENLKLEDDTSYTVAICGVTEDVAEEGKIQDTGILGLDAVREYVGQFDTLSKSDLVWE